MKKVILIAFILAAGLVYFLAVNNKACKLTRPGREAACSVDLRECQEKVLKYLKERKDDLALEEIAKIISIDPDDTCALWAKAEVLRRSYRFGESEELLNKVLTVSPGHPPSLITLAYIKYYEGNFHEAGFLLKEALRSPDLEKENEALVYMLMGSINAKKSSRGGLFGKLAYGTRIKGYFERAQVLAPDLPEVHLGLGTFCLLAPKIAGGDLERAIRELEWAVRLTPDFATANARLAQAYKRKGERQKYEFYIERAKGLDPENEVLKEIQEEQ